MGGFGNFVHLFVRRALTCIPHLLHLRVCLSSHRGSVRVCYEAGCVEDLHVPSRPDLGVLLSWLVCGCVGRTFWFPACHKAFFMTAQANADAGV